MLTNAQIDLERYRTLFKEDSIPKQQLDTQESLVRQFEGTIKADQSQVDNAKLQLIYCRITAPITGRVGLRLVDVGNMVHASDTTGLLVITQVQPITLVFTLPEDNLPAVLARMKGKQQLTVAAFDREQKQLLATGTLQSIDNQIDPTTGTVKLKAVFANSDGALFPNQFVNARILIDTLHNVTLVPNAAIQRSPQSTFVYTVNPDNTVAAKNVEVKLTQGDQTAIARGLNPGETVVIDGVDKLQPGTKVVARAADAAAELNDEPVTTFYFAADRNFVADGGAVARRRGRLQATAGFRFAASRLSDHSGHDFLSRREPGCHGFVGHRAAWSASSANCRGSIK